MTKTCKDCVAEGVTTKRPAIKPGPRCVTHWRAVVLSRKYSAHARHLENNFGISDEQYWKIYDAQGGRCYICQRAANEPPRHCCAPDSTEMKKCPARGHCWMKELA